MIFRIITFIAIVFSVSSYGQTTTVSPTNSFTSTNDFLGWESTVTNDLVINKSGPFGIDISTVSSGDGIYFDKSGSIGIGDFDSNSINAENKLNVNFGSNNIGKGVYLYRDGLIGNPEVTGGFFYNSSNSTTGNYGVVSQMYQFDEGLVAQIGYRSVVRNLDKPAAAIFGKAAVLPNSWAGYFMGTLYKSSSFGLSDENLKTNIETLTNMNDSLAMLNVYTYHFDTETYEHLSLPEGEHIGLMAQEVQNIFPTLIKSGRTPQRTAVDPNMTYEPIDLLCINYEKFIPILISAYQERQDLIESQNSQIDEMELQLQALELLLEEM